MMTAVKPDVDKARIAYNLIEVYGAQLGGYDTEGSVRIPPEDLVVKVLSDYLLGERRDPRFVEALFAVVTRKDFDWRKLHQLAAKADIGNRVHWLIRDFGLALDAEGLTEEAGRVRGGLPLFQSYRVPLEDALASEKPYRRRNVLSFASPAARDCGVPVVYDQDSLRKRADLNCRSAYANRS